MARSQAEPAFFATAAEWRAWLRKHHASRMELLVGFYKKDSGKASVTWPESVDAALCYGWIDGVRRNTGHDSYSIRFTPRKTVSTWSAVNIGRVEALTNLGLMHPAGVRAFEARQEKRSRIYAFEQASVAFQDSQERRFRANPQAWEFFQAQPAYYRRLNTWRVISAKREDTQEKRLAALIEASAAGRRLP